jgi:hypothetical protein
VAWSKRLYGPVKAPLIVHLNNRRIISAGRVFFFEQGIRLGINSSPAAKRYALPQVMYMVGADRCADYSGMSEARQSIVFLLQVEKRAKHDRDMLWITARQSRSSHFIGPLSR